jgi:DNA-binding transcriptional MocR family regulator
MTDLFHVIEDIAFRRMDIRPAEKIAERAEEGTLRATHAQLAAELGTAREVISRQLAEFQRRGWVDLGRGTVTLLDADALEQPRGELRGRFPVGKRENARFPKQNRSFAARRTAVFLFENRAFSRLLAAVRSCVTRSLIAHDRIGTHALRTGGSRLP